MPQDAALLPLSIPISSRAAHAPCEPHSLAEPSELYATLVQRFEPISPRAARAQSEPFSPAKRNELYAALVQRFDGKKSMAGRVASNISGFEPWELSLDELIELEVGPARRKMDELKAKLENIEAAVGTEMARVDLLSDAVLETQICEVVRAEVLRQRDEPTLETIVRDACKKVRVDQLQGQISTAVAEALAAHSALQTALATLNLQLPDEEVLRVLGRARARIDEHYAMAIEAIIEEPIEWANGRTQVVLGHFVASIPQQLVEEMGRTHTPGELYEELMVACKAKLVHDEYIAYVKHKVEDSVRDEVEKTKRAWAAHKLPGLLRKAHEAIVTELAQSHPHYTVTRYEDLHLEAISTAYGEPIENYFMPLIARERRLAALPARLRRGFAPYLHSEALRRGLKEEDFVELCAQGDRVLRALPPLDNGANDEDALLRLNRKFSQLPLIASAVVAGGAQAKALVYDSEHDNLQDELASTAFEAPQESVEVPWNIDALVVKAHVGIDRIIREKLAWRRDAVEELALPSDQSKRRPRPGLFDRWRPCHLCYRWCGGKSSERTCGLRCGRSGQAAAEQGKRCAARLLRRFVGLGVQAQLSFIFGFSAIFVCGILCLLGYVFVNTLKDSFLTSARIDLVDQMLFNNDLVMGQASRVLTARLELGVTSFIVPLFVTLFDASSSYSIKPFESYPDSSVATLRPPLLSFGRYRCDPTELYGDLRGCNASGALLVSTSASSVYLAGFPFVGSAGYAAVNVQNMLAAEATAVEMTSHMDTYMPTAWANVGDWVDAFVATPIGLFRQYPGAVGDLLHDDSGARTYNPSQQAWYLDTKPHLADWLAVSRQTRNTASWLGRPPTVIGKPYVDKFGRGYMLTITSLATDALGNELGVIGADMLVRDLDDVVAVLRSSVGSREAHLFHLPSKLVLNSPQLDPDSLGRVTTLPTIDDLRLPNTSRWTFRDLPNISGVHDCMTTALYDCMTRHTNGSYFAVLDDQQLADSTYQLTWLRVLDGQFADGQFFLLLVTPEHEITASVEGQFAVIEAMANDTKSTIVSVTGGFLVILLLSAFCTARTMSKPLVFAMKVSDRIVRNVGGDLLEGADLPQRMHQEATLDVDEEGDEEPTLGQKVALAIRAACDFAASALYAMYVEDPGEVKAMAHQFTGLLLILKEKHHEAIQLPPRSPFYRSDGNSTVAESVALRTLGATSAPVYCETARVAQRPLERSRSTQLLDRANHVEQRVSARLDDFANDLAGIANKAAAAVYPTLPGLATLINGQTTSKPLTRRRRRTAAEADQEEAAPKAYNASMAKKAGEQIRTPWNAILCQLIARLMMPVHPH